MSQRTIDSGERLGSYEVICLLGRGGMGEVWRARDTTLGREVAIKVLPEAFSADPDRRARFGREAKTLASLNHSNIVTIHSVEEVDGVHFLTMELIEGRSLEAVIADGSLSLERFFAIACGVSGALAAAHRAGIVHRDLKPSNIMLTDDGVIKVLDFGLAKVVEASPGEDDATLTTPGTQAGAIVGTPAWMAPEQAAGRPADERSDVFALGAVMYELLAGSAPFRRDSAVSTLAAVLHESPPPLRRARRDVPSNVIRIVNRCLAKVPAERFDSADELHRQLRDSRDRHLAPAVGLRSVVSSWRLAVPTLVALLAVAVGGGWWMLRTGEERRVRNDVLPQIEALADEGRHFEAYLMAREARTVLPGDPMLAALYERSTVPSRLTTDPAGAKVSFRAYRDVDGAWLDLGVSPIEDLRVPRAYLRFRIEKPGYETLETAFISFLGGLHFGLVAVGEAPPGMVRVPDGRFTVGRVVPLELPSYWIDQFEITNREYQVFVDAGGYSDLRYWQEPVETDSGTIPVERVLEAFVDSTGRAGPAPWVLGRYPEDADDLPVTGVSWYEAAAYARWAGKSLPTVYHWRRAAGLGAFADILTVSNFASGGPVSVGSLPGLGPFGTYDMAGNVKEWCWNLVGEERYTLGGAWNEPRYEFMDSDARSPLDRNLNQGIRCVQYDAPPPEESLDPIDAVRFDFGGVEPVSDDIYEVFAGLFDYRPVDLEATVDGVDDSATWWRRETVSFTAAYDGDRMVAHLFLPRTAEPPYPVVIYRPGASVNWMTRVEDFGSSIPEYLLRSGRAVAVPAYWGTLERGGGRPIPEGSNYRARVIRQIQDARRTVDYLESRDDVDTDRLAYVGLSAGGEYGAIYTAVEPRYDVAVFLAGGFHDSHMLGEPREVNPWHYAPRVRIPVLMVNGDNDFTLPVDTSQRPLFNLIATPAEHKRHVILESGHVPADRPALIREVLDWLDRYLGPVE